MDIVDLKRVYQVVLRRFKQSSHTLASDGTHGQPLDRVAIPKNELQMLVNVIGQDGTDKDASSIIEALNESKSGDDQAFIPSFTLKSFLSHIAKRIKQHGENAGPVAPLGAPHKDTPREMLFDTFRKQAKLSAEVSMSFLMSKNCEQVAEALRLQLNSLRRQETSLRHHLTDCTLALNSEVCSQRVDVSGLNDLVVEEQSSQAALTCEATKLQTACIEAQKGISSQSTKLQNLQEEVMSLRSKLQSANDANVRSEKAPMEVSASWIDLSSNVSDLARTFQEVQKERLAQQRYLTRSEIAAYELKTALRSVVPRVSQDKQLSKEVPSLTAQLESLHHEVKFLEESQGSLNANFTEVIPNKHPAQPLLALKSSLKLFLTLAEEQASLHLQCSEAKNSSAGSASAHKSVRDIEHWLGTLRSQTKDKEVDTANNAGANRPATSLSSIREEVCSETRRMLRLATCLASEKRSNSNDSEESFNELQPAGGNISLSDACRFVCDVSQSACVTVDEVPSEFADEAVQASNLGRLDAVTTVSRQCHEQMNEYLRQAGLQIENLERQIQSTQSMCKTLMQRNSSNQESAEQRLNDAINERATLFDDIAAELLCEDNDPSSVMMRSFYCSQASAAEAARMKAVLAVRSLRSEATELRRQTSNIDALTEELQGVLTDKSAEDKLGNALAKDVSSIRKQIEALSKERQKTSERIAETKEKTETLESRRDELLHQLKESLEDLTARAEALPNLSSELRQVRQVVEEAKKRQSEILEKLAMGKKEKTALDADFNTNRGMLLGRLNIEKNRSTRTKEAAGRFELLVQSEKEQLEAKLTTLASTAASHASSLAEELLECETREQELESELQLHRREVEANHERHTEEMAALQQSRIVLEEEAKTLLRQLKAAREGMTESGTSSSSPGVQEQNDTCKFPESSNEVTSSTSKRSVEETECEAGTSTEPRAKIARLNNEDLPTAGSD